MAEERKGKNFCTYCGVTVVSESDLFECSSCVLQFCREHIIIQEGGTEALCTFCAGDRT